MEKAQLQSSLIRIDPCPVRSCHSFDERRILDFMTVHEVAQWGRQNLKPAEPEVFIIKRGHKDRDSKLSESNTYRVEHGPLTSDDD